MLAQLRAVDVRDKHEDNWMRASQGRKLDQLAQVELELIAGHKVRRMVVLESVQRIVLSSLRLYTLFKR